MRGNNRQKRSFGSDRGSGSDRYGGGGGGFGSRNSFGSGGGGSGGGGGGFHSGPREMHKAKCSECGCDCEVPFQPTEGKPVYCKACYVKHKPQRF